MTIQKRIRLSLTRHDAATLILAIRQAVDDEPGMLTQEDAEIVNRIAVRLYRLLHPHSHLTRPYNLSVEPKPLLHSEKQEVQLCLNS